MRGLRGSQLTLRLFHCQTAYKLAFLYTPAHFQSFLKLLPFRRVCVVAQAGLRTHSTAARTQPAWGTRASERAKRAEQKHRAQQQ